MGAVLSLRNVVIFIHVEEGRRRQVLYLSDRLHKHTQKQQQNCVPIL